MLRYINTLEEHFLKYLLLCDGEKQELRTTQWGKSINAEIYFQWPHSNQVDVFIEEQKEGWWDLFVQGDSKKVVCEDLIVLAGEWRGSQEYLLAEGEKLHRHWTPACLRNMRRGIWRRRHWLQQEGLSCCLQGAELSLVGVSGLTTEMSNLELQKQVSETYEKENFSVS